jgi:hypothetical protein
MTRITTIEQQLRDPLIRIDAIEKPSAITDFKRQVTFPPTFGWRNVDQDT